MTERPPDIDALTLAQAAGLDLPSDRGRIRPPDLDDRRWQDLVDEAVVRIKKRAPQWTDQNPSDIGMTLVELFAWLTETLIYRLNRVPEKQYVAFLNLLGITRSPQQPARTLLRFTAQPGVAEIPAGTPVQTPGTESVLPVVFETDTALLPCELLAAGAEYLVVPKTGTRTYDDVSTAITSGSSAARQVDLALDDLAVLCVAVTPPSQQPGLFDVYVEPVRSILDTVVGQKVDWVYSSSAPTVPPDPATWKTFEVVSDATAGLTLAGLVRLRLPAGVMWEAQKTATWPSGPTTHTVTTALRWIGLRVTRVKDPRTADNLHLRLRLDRLMLCTTSASAVTSVKDEKLDEGDGTPHQVLRLAHRPVYARPRTDSPYDHVKVTVGGQEWTPVEFLSDGAAAEYLLDPVTGELTFGDHDPVARTGQGTVPKSDQQVVASYRYVSAGAAGNVPAGLLRVLTRTLPGVTGVANPMPATGGTEEEPVEETKRRAPDLLRRGDRAVTVEDYEELALTASSDIAAVRCLSPRQTVTTGAWWTYGGIQRTPGKVNLIVVPDFGPGVRRPQPSLALSREVHRILDRRCDVTAELAVVGPRYVPVGVKVTVQVFQKAIDDGLIVTRAEVDQKVRERIFQFLHPVHGGRGGVGWAVGESVFESDVYQAIRPDERLGYISALALVLERPPYFEEGSVARQRPETDVIDKDAKQVRLFDYELVCPGNVAIVGGTE